MRVDLDQSAISRIESGGSASTRLLIALSETLEVPLWDLLRPVKPHVAHLRAKAHSEVSDDALERLDKFLDDCDFLIHLRAFKGSGDEPLQSSIRIEEMDGYAQGIRSQIGIGPIEPVDDLVRRAESLNLLVLLQPLPSDDFSGAYVRGEEVCACLINTGQYEPRLYWTVAHELGHHLVGGDGAVDDMVPPSFQVKPAAERSADAFAGHFLVPDAVLTRMSDIRDPRVVAETAGRYHLSYPAMVYRLKNSGKIDARSCRRLLDGKPRDYDASYFQSPIPQGAKSLPASFSAAARRTYERGQITVERLAELIDHPADKLRAILAWETSYNGNDVYPQAIRS